MKRVGLCLVLLLAPSGAGLRAEPAASGAGAPVARPAGKKSKAKSKTAAAPAGLANDKLEALRLALTGADDAAAIEAAGALGASGTAAAGEPLCETLAAGADAARLGATLDALGKLGEAHALGDSETTIDALELYAGHRAPDVRRRAIRALGTIADPRVVPTLLDRLGDAASDVRAAAAEALGARREAKAVPRLFALLKLGDAGAAGPIAAVATPDLIPRIAELGGTIDDGIVATALGEYVKRGDVPDKLRIDVLRTLGRLSGAAATTALVEYVASVPAKEDRPSKHEAEKLIDARGATP